MSKPDETIAIIGAGQMGIAIAATFLKQGFAVTLFDVSQQAIETARQRVEAELVMQDEASPDNESTNNEPADKTNAMDDALGLLRCTVSLADACQASFVIESITEKLRAKAKLYAKITPLLGDSALLVSNTSTISIDELAATLSPDADVAKDDLAPVRKNAPHFASRFCGFHFFHPVRKRSLIEIIRGKATSHEMLERVTRLAAAIGKTPLVVNNGPGFVVNRLLNAYLSGALQLLTAGGTIRQIDAAAEQFGMAMGPFRMMDEIGLDVTLHGGWVLYKSFPDRVEPSRVLLDLVHEGTLGRKTCCGFYRYESTTMWESSGTDNNRLNAKIADEYREGRKSPLPSMTNEMLIDRMIGEMFREGRHILEDGIVCSAAEIELAVVLGLGFPKNRWKKPFASRGAARKC